MWVSQDLSISDMKQSVPRFVFGYRLLMELTGAPVFTNNSNSMKIISWNVNGIRAAWNHGLAPFLENSEADIYAFQEIRTDTPYTLVEREGYHAFWSCCKKKGYSGTVCLSRHKPLNVRYDMGDPDFDIEEPCGANENAPPPKRAMSQYTYQDIIVQKHIDFPAFLKNTDLTHLWESVDWEQAEQNLRRMQAALAKVAQTKNPVLIAKWQKRITFSLDARLLAVRHTCETGGGAGIDNIKWTTPHEKMFAALSFTTFGYQAMPSRLLLIQSKNGKERRIHIDTYYDRAMQCLYAYALDPIAESWGDRKSFAYRKGRSAYDLNEYIKRGLSAEKIKLYTEEFLEERGLTLANEKCQIVHIRDGFTFMGRTYYKSGTQVFARPSDKSIGRFMDGIHTTIDNYTGSQKSLIAKLNHQIDGWATFHKVGEADDVFRQMDVYISALLLNLCESKHPQWDREKILTFAQMESIMGGSLGTSALRKEFWYRTGYQCISQCWLEHGYSIQALHLKDKRIDFRLAVKNKNASNVVIPDTIKYGKIPEDAKYELENYFQYIRGKYGI